MKSQFSQLVQDIFDEPEASEWGNREVTENSRLLATAHERSRSPGMGGSLVDSVDN